MAFSYKYVNRTVNDILADAFPVSLELGGLGLILAVSHRRSARNTRSRQQRQKPKITSQWFFATAGISVPGFVIGALLIFVFGIWLRILPVALWEHGRSMILPAVTLAASPAAYIARLTRASVLDVLEKDWVRTARSKGLSGRSTVIKHVLRNALVPVATVLGPLTAILITGSFVVEYIYASARHGALLHNSCRKSRLRLNHRNHVDFCRITYHIERRSRYHLSVS